MGNKHIIVSWRYKIYEVLFNIGIILRYWSNVCSLLMIPLVLCRHGSLYNHLHLRTVLPFTNINPIQSCEINVFAKMKITFFFSNSMCFLFQHVCINSTRKTKQQSEVPCYSWHWVTKILEKWYCTIKINYSLLTACGCKRLNRGFKVSDV